MKRTLISLVVAATISTVAIASETEQGNTWKAGAKDAWIDGKAEATLLFNGHLDSFDINTDVKDGEVTLTGKVENSVEKKLAEELVMNIDGVTGVNNKLTIGGEESNLAEVKDDMKSGVDKGMKALNDAKIATVVKTRLLMDADISGFAIDVDVEDGKVTLKGEVESDAQRQLAIEIARNATDVVSVEDELNIVTNTASRDS